MVQDSIIHDTIANVGEEFMAAAISCGNMYLRDLNWLQKQLSMTKLHMNLPDTPTKEPNPADDIFQRDCKAAKELVMNDYAQYGALKESCAYSKFQVQDMVSLFEGPPNRPPPPIPTEQPRSRSNSRSKCSSVQSKQKGPMPSPARAGSRATSKNIGRPAWGSNASTTQKQNQGKTNSFRKTGGSRQQPQKVSLNTSRPSITGNLPSAQELISAWNNRNSKVPHPQRPPLSHSSVSKKDGNAHAGTAHTKASHGQASQNKGPAHGKPKAAIKTSEDRYRAEFEARRKREQERRASQQANKGANALPPAPASHATPCHTPTSSPNEMTPTAGQSHHKQNTFVTPISKHGAPATPFSSHVKPGAGSAANIKALQQAMAEKTKKLREQKLKSDKKIKSERNVKERLDEFRKKNEAREQAAKMAKERQLALVEEKKKLAEQKAREDAELAKRQERESYDNYEMSDHENDSSDYESDYERDARAKKSIPEWAQGASLTSALERQYGIHRIDPDSIFPDGFETCDLNSIFRHVLGAAARRRSKSYNARGSTGNWKEDRLTFVEKLTYRRDMGFKKGQVKQK